MNKHLLTFEYSQLCDVLNIHFDDEGLNNFILILEKMRSNKCHEHMATESWGGNELSEEPQLEGGKMFNKVTLHKW
jgi:hypothetical protein